MLCHWPLNHLVAIDLPSGLRTALEEDHIQRGSRPCNPRGTAMEDSFVLISCLCKGMEREDKWEKTLHSKWAGTFQHRSW